MMSPAQKLRWAILVKAAEWAGVELPSITADNLDEVWDEKSDELDGHLWDARNEVRCSGEETGLPAPYSRHYEGDAVAAKMPDGSWVGWVYWHGGGKHGEPEAIEWIEFAYDVTVTEEEKLVTVRTFKEVE